MNQIKNRFGQDIISISDCVYIRNKVLSSFDIPTIEEGRTISNYISDETEWDFVRASTYIHMNFTRPASVEVNGTGSEAYYLNVADISIDEESGYIRFSVDRSDDGDMCRLEVVGAIQVVGNIVRIDNDTDNFVLISLHDKPQNMLRGEQCQHFPMVIKQSRPYTSKYVGEQILAVPGYDRLFMLPSLGAPMMNIISYSATYNSGNANIIDIANTYYTETVRKIATKDGLKVGSIVRLANYYVLGVVGVELSSQIICTVEEIRSDDGILMLRVLTDIKHTFDDVELLMPIGIDAFCMHCECIYPNNAYILAPGLKLIVKNGVSITMPLSIHDVETIDRFKDTKDIAVNDFVEEFLAGIKNNFDVHDEYSVSIFYVDDVGNARTWCAHFHAANADEEGIIRP